MEIFENFFRILEVFIENPEQRVYFALSLVGGIGYAEYKRWRDIMYFTNGRFKKIKTKSYLRGPKMSALYFSILFIVINFFSMEEPSSSIEIAFLVRVVLYAFHVFIFHIILIKLFGKKFDKIMFSRVRVKK